MGKVVITINTNGEVAQTELSEITYKFLNESCGGYIQSVYFSNGVSMYCNEEGKMNGLPYNHKATALWTKDYGQTDLISGNVVLVGEPDDEGDDQGLTQSQIDEVMETLNNAGEPTPAELDKYQRILAMFR
jgi:hypothetical protein